MIVGVLSDTHVPSRGRSIPGAAWDRLAGADLILHAGDVCTTGLLDELQGLAPLHVAVGNCDPAEVRAWGARDRVELELDGVRVAMVHDSGATEGRARRLRRMFPEADVVVFGHSHMPLLAWEEGLMLLNPGSPNDRRRAPRHTIAMLTILGGEATAELVSLD